MEPSAFSQMPAPPPAELTTRTLLATMLQTAAFRYHWATDGLSATALTFRPSPGSMSLEELLHHMHRLAWWLEATFAERSAEPEPKTPLDETRAATLTSLGRAASAVLETSPEALAATTIQRGQDAPGSPLWNVLHGPLADFLTHVGQVTSWRRIQGSPAPAARYFDGLGPTPTATK